MPFSVLFVLLAALAIYWFMTQILPERRRASLLRPSLRDGLLMTLNEHRQTRRLPLLELDDELARVAENKAVHQVLTGESEEGWDYSPDYEAMLGQSLLMEALFVGPAASLADRLIRQRDILDPEWVCCGMGAAMGHDGQTVVALILCREAWEPVAEAPRQRSLLERLML